MINQINDKYMKKSILLSVLIIFSIHVMSQEKGSYISIYGGLGPTGFKYSIAGVNNFATPKTKIQLGGQAGLSYSYYFTKHFGVSAGLGLSHYRTKGFLTGDFDREEYFLLGRYKDNDYAGNVTDYQLRVRTKDWAEYQSCTCFEIPILVNMQKKFGAKEGFGLYLALGLKLQIPFGALYEIIDGESYKQPKLNVTGFYPEKNLEIGYYGDPLIPQHGFGSIHNPSVVLNDGRGDLKMKFNMSLVAEGGVLISLGRRVDLALGAFIDKGILNINKKQGSPDLFTGPNSIDYVADAEDNVGKGITYSSLLNSNYVNKVTTISFGGKVGLRIKLGKLSPRPQDEPQRSDTTVIKYDNAKIDSAVNSLKDAVDALKDEIAKEKSLLPKDSYIKPDGKYTAQEREILLEPIYFDLNKYELKPASIKTLDRKVELLKEYPELNLIIYGNTCDLGSDPLNYKLGANRAEASKKYLVSKGIAADRLDTTTLSRFEPEKPNTSESNRLFNRRADFKIKK
jgi:outer membrane protein OmpA-like peptidoglycan-associated protein